MCPPAAERGAHVPPHVPPLAHLHPSVCLPANLQDSSPCTSSTYRVAVNGLSSSPSFGRLDEFKSKDPLEALPLPVRVAPPHCSSRRVQQRARKQWQTSHLRDDMVRGMKQMLGVGSGERKVLDAQGLPTDPGSASELRRLWDVASAFRE